MTVPDLGRNTSGKPARRAPSFRAGVFHFLANSFGLRNCETWLQVAWCETYNGVPAGGGLAFVT